MDQEQGPGLPVGDSPLIRVLSVLLAASLLLNAALLPFWPKHKELKQLLDLRDLELRAQQAFYLEELEWSETHCKNVVEVERVVTKTITKIREVPALATNSCDVLSDELGSLLDESYRQLFPATTGGSL